MDGDLGIVTEPDVLPEDVYPFQLVDEPCGIKGSCVSYNSRTKIGNNTLPYSVTVGLANL